jgi:hypothetical protein
MNILKFYFSGLKAAVGTIKMATLIYALMFLMALIIAIPFHNALSSQIGNTMALHAMLRHFNYTIYSDFMNSSGKFLNGFILSALWMGIFYFLFTVFFTGGILNIINENSQKYSIVNFLTGCGKYFFRFFRLAIYLLVTQFLIVLIIFFPLSKILSANYQTTQNEASLFFIFLSGISIFTLIFILILIIGDYTKIILFHNDSRKVVRTFGKSIRLVFSHLFGTYTLYLLILSVFIILFIFYFLVDNVIVMSSALTILVMFLLQQAFIWLRVLIKIWFLSSENFYYKYLTETEVADLPEEKIQYNLSEGRNEDENGYPG